MTVKEAAEILSAAGIESAEYDARELFIHFTDHPRHGLLSPATSSDVPELLQAVKKRAEHIPLQYIIGEVGFYRESYRVTPSVLIPRSDTEILVDFAVRNIPSGESFIDLCTGSGCIAISTLKNTVSTSAYAVDISPEALSVARENARLNGVAERISFSSGNALEFTPEREVFAVLSNPPYVTAAEYEDLAPELYHEPKIALVGEDEGLVFYKHITKNCRDKIKNGGFIAYEIGSSQADALRAIANEYGMSAEIIKDLSGLDRVAVLRKPISE